MIRTTIILSLIINSLATNAQLIKNEIETRCTYFKGDTDLESIELLKGGQNIAFYSEFYPNGSVKINGQFLCQTQSALKAYDDSMWIQTLYGLGEFVLNYETYTSPKNGKWQYFYENGTIQIDGQYENNKRDGVWRYYGDYGDLVVIRTYKMGLFVNDELITKKAYVLPPE